MRTAIEELSRWLVGRLAEAPDSIKAVYVEWNHSYLEPNTPREIVLVSLAAFGFDSFSKGDFDSSNPDDLARLGEFVWEGRRALHLRDSDYPGLDWTDALGQAAATPEVRTLTRGRNLLLLVGYHDDAVFDVS